jgi:hypothetical protein
MKKNKTQETNNHPTHTTVTNNFGALPHVETKCNTKHEIKDPAPPTIFVRVITNMQPVTATNELVVNRLNCTLE